MGLKRETSTWIGIRRSYMRLDEDMQNWLEGDLTVVGSKGFMLSGGQKQSGKLPLPTLLVA